MRAITDEQFSAIESFFYHAETIDKEANLLDNLLQDALCHEQETGGGAQCGDYFIYVRNLKELIVTLKNIEKNSKEIPDLKK